jgi:cytoskeletal protein CcmA (bactofilin family)
MKKLLSFYVFFMIPLSYSLGQSTNGEGDPNGRENWVPNRGNVGIGTRSPVEALEVIGNVKVSETIFTNSLQTVGLSAVNLSVSQDANVGRNLFVAGNVGINVTNPVERLEVGGNIKASGDLFGKDLHVKNGFFKTVFAEGNINANGNVGIGVTAPTDKLEVSGNIKASGNLFAKDVHADKGFFNSLESDGNLNINGNVGIGVVPPTEKLDVNGNVKATGAFIGQSAQLSLDAVIGNNLTVNGKIGLGIAPGTDRLTVGGTSYFNGLLTAENITVKQKLDLKGAFTVAGTFGVGVATPESALHVNGDGRFNGDIRANKLIVKAIEIEGAPGGSPNGETSSVSLGDNLFVNGAMGIGTTKINGYRLSVDGKIRAGDDIKVYISSEWSDFVFDEKYKLMPLEKLSEYIQANNHLPEIPSAENIKSNGFDLGAMDAKLLQKIEELTLYVIEIKMENNELKREIDRIKSVQKNK